MKSNLLSVHGLVGLWASLPWPQIPYPPQVQLGPNLVLKRVASLSDLMLNVDPPWRARDPEQELQGPPVAECERAETKNGTSGLWGLLCRKRHLQLRHVLRRRRRLLLDG